jgi:hypothetical protein
MVGPLERVPSRLVVRVAFVAPHRKLQHFDGRGGAAFGFFYVFLNMRQNASPTGTDRMRIPAYRPAEIHTFFRHALNLADIEALIARYEPQRGSGR